MTAVASSTRQPLVASPADAAQGLYARSRTLRGHPHRRCRGLLAHYFLAFEGGQTAIARSARYSRLIGAAEAGTLQAFKTIKTELLDPTIEAHNGELLSQRATGCSSSSGV
jgi:hypothetical protein